MDREKVISRIETICEICKENKWMTEFTSDVIYPILSDALALLKEQEEKINDFENTIRQLNQHIKDLGEYMTPYGKVKDVKAYSESHPQQ